MKYCIIAYGCQFNKSDSERAAAILKQMGLAEASGINEADLVLVLACSVRQTAVDRLYGLKAKFDKIRCQRPLITVLSGCVLEHDKKKMAEFFDLILPAKDLSDLPKLLLKQLTGLPAYKLTSFSNIHPSHDSSFQAYVPIITGCNNFCSYCVVPYTRGREVSRPAAEIVKECKDLIGRGYKEIVLIGQNVNSYEARSKKQEARIDFTKLLKKIDDLPGDYWLSFATSHPKDLSDELIKVMAEGRHIMPYLHLPAQSGDDEILKKMNRRYTVRHYLGLIKKARKAMPDLTVSTDIIVGFPGETKKQFLNTAKLFREAKFDMAYIAQYSPRAGTAAAKLSDNVPGIEKKKREKILTQILRQTALAHNKKYVKKTVRVLVDGHKAGRCFGRTDTFKIVSFAGLELLIGQFVEVKITQAGPWSLKGRLVATKGAF